MPIVDDPNQPRDHDTPQSAPTIGSSILVRVVALLTAAVLLALVGHFVHRCTETIGGLSDWILPIVAAVAGAVYNVLVSSNLVGRTTPGSVSSLRRIGAVAAPPVLIFSAVARARDVLVDPYARRYGATLWILTALAACVIALVIACLGWSHWHDKTPSVETVNR